jgi:photosystem II stability/assembly factor-like uncharacterized protein
VLAEFADACGQDREGLMFKFPFKWKGAFISFMLIVLISAAVWFFDVKDLCAHSPHDPIDALVISPAYDEDQTLFIISVEQFLRSTDGGLSWKQLVNGLDYQDVLSSVAISPHYRQDGTLFVSSEGDGIYRSQDGGDSWVRVNSGLDELALNLLAISPAYHVGEIVLASGIEGGLYKSANGGDSWQQVIGDEIQVTAVTFSPDAKRDCAFVGDSRGVLYLSTDGGEGWQQIFRTSNAGAITSVAISPYFSSDGTLFVGTGKGGIFRSADGGVSFTEINEGLSFTLKGKYGTLRESKDGPVIRRSEKDVISIAISPNYREDGTVFASLWNEAIFKSEDGGDTWRRYTLGLTCDYQADSEKFKSAHFRGVVLSNAFARDKTVFLGGFDGLFKSTDGGRHWAQMETFPLSLVAGLALSPGDRDRLSVAITTYGGGAYTTDDQEIAWTIRNNGLATTRLTDIAFSPDFYSDDTMFSASTGYILRSTCSGDHWDRVPLGYFGWRRSLSSILNRRLRIPNVLTRLLLTRSERDAPYPTVFAVSPDFASDGTLYFGTRYHGVFRSVDRGLNPSMIWDGEGQLITSLAISPDFSSDGTLFAGAYGAGIYKTVDRGETWLPAHDGLAFIDAWRSSGIDQITRRYDILLAISPHYKTDQTVFVACSEGLFKTTDGGHSWQELQGLTSDSRSYVVALAVSPDYENDQTVVVSVKGKGLFESGDGGKTFTEIGSDLIDSNHMVKLIGFSASNATGDVIYAASDEEIFRSTDGGNTWETIHRPVRYEDNREVVRYEGPWEVSKSDGFSAGTVTLSDIAHSRADLSFVGTGVSWIGTESSDGGIAHVYIDGKHMGDVDQFSEARRNMMTVYSITGLSYGSHSIAVEVAGMKNPRSMGYRIELDAFDVIVR